MRQTTPVLNLTDMTVKQMKAPQTGRLTVRDSGVPGLELRITSNGHKSFSYKFTCPIMFKPGQRLGIGRFPNITVARAREKAREAMAKIDLSINPTFEKAQARADVPQTFGEVKTAFIEEHAKQKRAWKQVEARLNYNLSAWDGRPVKSITKADAVAAVRAVRARGADVEANRLISNMSTLFAWALEFDLIDALPFSAIRKTDEIERDRVLDDDELKSLWSACDCAGWPFGPAVKLMVLTAQRVQEVGKMQWTDIDLDAKLWTIPRWSKKEFRPSIVPLSPMVVDILAGLPRFNSALVFPAKGNLENAASGYSKAKARLDDLSGIENWQFRDIRRTAATHMAGLEVEPHVVEKILNHSTGTIKGVAAIYNRFQYLPQKTLALNNWAQVVASIVASREARAA